jgi:uracil-DNA glycosylase family 4
MDARALAELELLQVARLYGRVGASAVASPEPGAIVAPPAARPGAAPARIGEPAVTPAEVAAAGWDQLRAMVAQCRACGLCAQRKQAVFGVGAQNGPWLFVGEGPGAEEDERGEPFVGQAGRLLDAMLAAIGCARGRDTYIANVVKCRPPGNRTPATQESAACAPFLDRQIALVAPRLIVALGRSAAARLLGTDASLASLRGRVHRHGDIPVVVTYHPAYLLRAPPEKARAWEDLVFARRVLREQSKA